MIQATAISFDLDETLWRLGDVLERAEAAARARAELEHAGFAEAWTPATIAMLRKEVLQRWPGIAHDPTGIRLRVLLALARRCGAPERVAEQAMDVFLEARNAVELYPETLGVLDGLTGRYRLVALTNGNADVHKVGLGRYFHAALQAGMVGAAKPSPRIFEAACAAVGARPSQIVHVGDDPEADVVGAANAGLHAVWLNRDRRPWPPHLPEVPRMEIDGLGALAALLGPADPAVAV